ncbi:zf-C3HC-domain-containing protein [Zopfia rhizophila CBS 207.26]|uniref:Zf-C3HC-domain-containing protein n=1 Tax=Zopfia rhizophila CBS 207.26 TaxID=1314779 RepID=A0A6A6ES30_9PEZI|nr:zf-C3HC-domain-containing protein [Zopfia rhizophila CBS 207.26]
MSTPSPGQPALTTTKRKFHKLLDSLTASKSTTSLADTLTSDNASTTSPTELATPEPPSKRSRLSDVSNISMDRPRAVSGERVRALQDKLLSPRKSADKPRGVYLVGKKTGTLSPSSPRKAPNYAPYSQEQFLARLKTFADVKKWGNKPDAIGEVEWAKRGWICENWNTVACKGGCDKRVVVRLRPRRKDADGKVIEGSEDLDVEVEEGLVEKYRELIVEGHDEGCLWRKGACKDDIYHIQIPNRAQSSAELLSRYHSFRAISSHLPPLENISYPDPSITEILKRIPSTLFNPPGATITEQPPTSPTDITAFVFALFGWTGVSESKLALARCNHCFQRVGLWLYNSSRLTEMSKKLDIPIEQLRLDLLESHREHCPWKNGVSQKNGDGVLRGMPGWETLQFIVVGRRKEGRGEGGSASFEMVRGSEETERGSRESDEKSVDKLAETWRKLKSKLKRSASRKSLRSVKSGRSAGG